MSHALSIEHLTKRFDKFTLADITFAVPTGSVVGLIGENGAGKSTTIKLILNLLHADAGNISVLGMEHRTHEADIKQRIGVVSEAATHPQNFRAGDVGRILSTAYPNWDNDAFHHYLRIFAIDPVKKCKDLSKGMRMKLSIASALCHDAQLLILDEPTSGLDPVVRDEVLDILRDFMQDEKHSILMSSHITSDLEKIADYVTFLHEGRVLFSKSMLELNESYGILRCAGSMVQDFTQDAVYAVRNDQFGAEILVDPRRIPAGLHAEPASIEQIMLFLSRHAVSAQKEGL